jgi:hypothetical protein
MTSMGDTARALLRPPHRGLAAVAAVAVLATSGYAAVACLRPPTVQSANAATADFSAARAAQHVRTIAARPHVAGSAANDAVRGYLVARLRGLGLSPAVQDTVTVQGAQLSSSAGGIGVARVRNVVATLPGTAPTGRIFLVAHYDSVQVGPGGNDDAAGVSSILEIARALTASPRLRNDVVLVLTDAEEACLCGAKAFVDQNPLARSGGVVLNLESRGDTGSAIMFETSAGNAALISRFSRVPNPVGTSVAVEVYRRLPNDTDFTPFQNAGFAGLNSAYIDGAAVYHTPTDLPSTMDLRSLQHLGGNGLALVRTFGGEDLRTIGHEADATYFPIPGGLLRYPGLLVWPLAILAVLAVLALAVLARRRGLVAGGRLAGAVPLTLIPIALAPVLAQAFWFVLTLLRPGYAALPVDPYRPLWYRLAVIALTAAVVLGWYALFRRRFGPATLAIGGLAWLAALGVLLAAFVPGGSYLTVLPALAGAVTGIVAILLRGGWTAVVAVLAGAAAAVVVLVPAVLMFLPALGLRLAAAGGFVCVLLGLALLPVVDLLHPSTTADLGVVVGAKRYGKGIRATTTPRSARGLRGMEALRARRRGALPFLAALLAAIAFTAVGLRVDQFDATHPVPTHLMYALDSDTGQARWFSSGRRRSGPPSTCPGRPGRLPAHCPHSDRRSCCPGRRPPPRCPLRD